MLIKIFNVLLFLYDDYVRDCMSREDGFSKYVSVTSKVRKYRRVVGYLVWKQVGMSRDITVQSQ